MLLIVGILSTVVILVAMYMASLGAWMVLPFCGLELVVLVVANYQFLRGNTVQEVIDFSNDWVTIERGSKRPDHVVKLQRYWARARVIAPRHRWYPEQVTICAMNEQVEVGGFLNDEDRTVLIRELTHLLNAPSL